MLIDFEQCEFWLHRSMEAITVMSIGWPMELSGHKEHDVEQMDNLLGVGHKVVVPLNQNNKPDQKGELCL